MKEKIVKQLSSTMNFIIKSTNIKLHTCHCKETKCWIITVYQSHKIECVVRYEEIIMSDYLFYGAYVEYFINSNDNGNYCYYSKENIIVLM